MEKKKEISVFQLAGLELVADLAPHAHVEVLKALDMTKCIRCNQCSLVCPHAAIRPAKEKALTMQPLESQLNQAENWEYAVETVTVKADAVSDKTVKASRFAKPYFEFSGACAGCGETPYIKLVTQLFGDHMYITNASGCSSAYGGSTPSSPYCTDCKVTKKKDLGLVAMSYGYVYVAQVAMGADPAQTLKAIRKAYPNMK